MGLPSFFSSCLEILTTSSSDRRYEVDLEAQKFAKKRDHTSEAFVHPTSFTSTSAPSLQLFNLSSNDSVLSHAESYDIENQNFRYAREDNSGETSCSPSPSPTRSPTPEPEDNAPAHCCIDMSNIFNGAKDDLLDRETNPLLQSQSNNDHTPVNLLNNIISRLFAPKEPTSAPLAPDYTAYINNNDCYITILHSLSDPTISDLAKRLLPTSSRKNIAILLAFLVLAGASALLLADLGGAFAITLGSIVFSLSTAASSAVGMLASIVNLIVNILVGARSGYMAYETLHQKWENKGWNFETGLTVIMLLIAAIAILPNIGLVSQTFALSSIGLQILIQVLSAVNQFVQSFRGINNSLMETLLNRFSTERKETRDIAIGIRKAFFIAINETLEQRLSDTEIESLAQGITHHRNFELLQRIISFIPAICIFIYCFANWVIGLTPAFNLGTGLTAAQILSGIAAITKFFLLTNASRNALSAFLDKLFNKPILTINKEEINSSYFPRLEFALKIIIAVVTIILSTLSAPQVVIDALKTLDPNNTPPIPAEVLESLKNSGFYDFFAKMMGGTISDENYSLLNIWMSWLIGAFSAAGINTLDTIATVKAILKAFGDFWYRNDNEQLKKTNCGETLEEQMKLLMSHFATMSDREIAKEFAKPTNSANSSTPFWSKSLNEKAEQLITDIKASNSSQASYVPI